jgi:hypothetical protein
MKFHKRINNNIIAVAGTWDPVLPRHRELFRELLRYSKKKGLNPYIFLFYPNPLNYIHENKYKDYFDLDARIELFKHLGINNIIVLDFDREDLKQSVANFFDALFAARGIVLNELWIGENQALGSGPAGFLSTGMECSARNIKLRILKNSFLVNLDKDEFNRNFRQCKFDVTSAVIGYLPTFKLKADHQINMYDGVYDALLRIKPFDKTGEVAVKIEIMDGKLGRIERGDGHDWVVLVEKVAAGSD